MENIKEQFARLYMEIDLTDDQAAMIKKLQRDVDAALRQPLVSGSGFSAFRSPKFNCNEMFDTKEELLMAIIKCLPYPDQITDLDFSTEKDAIRLTWRKTNKFRISTNGHVEEVGDGVLMGSDISIMFRELIKRQYASGL